MFRTHNRHNKKEQDNSCSYIQRGTKRQKGIECPHPTLRLVKNTRYGWDSRTRTCKARVKVSCVAVTPYPIGIMRTPGKGALVRSFGIITQSGFLVNIQASPTEECGGVFASVPIGGIVFVGRAGGRCTRVRGCAGCMRYMRYRGGVRSDVRDTVEMCGGSNARHAGGGAARGHFLIPADGGAVRAWYNADCARVWGVRWRVRLAWKYGTHGRGCALESTAGAGIRGARRVCASAQQDNLHHVPCIRMCPRFSGAAFG